MSIVYFGEAWNQYRVYAAWFRRGSFSDAYHIPYELQGTCYGVLIALFQFIILPVRRSLGRLKVERKVRE